MQYCSKTRGCPRAGHGRQRWREFCRALERAGEAVLRAETPARRVRSRRGLPLPDAPVARGAREPGRVRRSALPGLLPARATRRSRSATTTPTTSTATRTSSGRYRYRISRHARRRAVPLLRHQGRRLRDRRHDAADRPARRRRARHRADGRFEIVVSARAREGQLAADAAEHDAADRARDVQRPRDAGARALAIERLGARRGRRARPRRSLEQRLLRAVAFVSGTANLFVDWMDALCRAPERAALGRPGALPARGRRRRTSTTARAAGSSAPTRRS